MEDRGRDLTPSSGHAQSRFLPGEREDPLMARKNYSEEFRRDAVELYRVSEGATITAIAGDLGITDATLSACL